MKIVFFGTPEFAIPTLKALHESKHDVVAVVTAPDKERGRGRKVSVTPVKQFALENEISVLTPQKLKAVEFEKELKSLNADLFVILAFRILPENIFTIPPKGAFNLHGSLLPKYRGAAPIQWAIINGEKETGVTTFFLKKKVDTGNIIHSRKIEIEDSDNLGTLHDKMSLLGAELVLETVNLIEIENYELTEQNNALATPAPKITKETCLINWNKTAEEIHNLVRGLSPYPAAFFIHNDKQYKIYSTKISDTLKLKPSEIKQTKFEIFLGTTTTALQILEIQPEGRKRMDAESFLRGYSLI
ncbi:MAG: methionyl-tRNA formyltransferase [Ignavibacteriae bacterium]|nr:MAG: methionyl-tRNA formyltransferase [Ignavibacteriota bacterium]